MMLFIYWIIHLFSQSCINVVSMHGIYVTAIIRGRNYCSPIGIGKKQICTNCVVYILEEDFTC